MQDYKGRGTATGPLLPSIGVPTTAGTGSETQSFALVTDVDTGMKMACGDPRAAFRVAILDVNLTLTQPATVTALTGIDAVAHAVESHVSRAATPASRVFSRAAWGMLAENLPRVLADGGDLEARAAVQLAAAWAGLAIENSMLGAAHALANPLTARHGLPHGQAVGMMLPHVVRFNGPACGAGYAELLAEVGLDADAAEAGDLLARRIAELLRAAGLPERLADARAGGCDAAALAAEAAAQWTAGFNPRRADAEPLAALYEAAR
jgi:alcohol dehydrogenase